MENVGLVTFTEGVPVPVQGDRRLAPAPGRDDPARAGPHVVRRPGHHALVERPVAQGVLRHLHGRRGARPRRPAGRGAWTTFANGDKCVGARARTSCPPRTRSWPPSPTSRTSQLNFDGITYAKGAAVLKQLVAWVGSDAFFAGVRAYFRRHAWGVTDAGRPAGGAGGRVRSRPGGVGSGVAADHRSEHAAPGVSRSRRTGRSPRSRSVQEGHPTLRSHRIAIGLYTRQPAGSRRTGSSSTSPAPGPPVPELVGQARPDLVLLNDDDLTYADDAAGRAFTVHSGLASRRPRRSVGPGAVLVGRLGHGPQRRSWVDASSSAWCSAASTARPR